MPRASVATTNPERIDVEYDTIGSPDDPALLLVMGFTAQLIAWEDGFCQALADRGRYVIRYDNRDCGLSTNFDGVKVDPQAVMRAQLDGDAEAGRRRTRCRTWPTTASGCSTSSASTGPTSSGRRWAG